jgi:hypothetical protein
MAAPTLDEVRRLVDQLPPVDQARLVEYLAPRIARALADAQSISTLEADHSRQSNTHSDAWQRFFRIGEEIARSTPPGAESMTAAVQKMRR